MDGVLVRGPTLLLVREELDEVVDAEDGDGGLGGELQALGLHHGGLVHARLLVISRLPVDQVQTDPVTAQETRSEHKTFDKMSATFLSKTWRKSQTASCILITEQADPATVHEMHS